MIEYNCPHCDEVLIGGFGETVYCKKCDKSYETDWDYTEGYSIVGWLTGKEYEGET